MALTLKIHSSGDKIRFSENVSLSKVQTSAMLPSLEIIKIVIFMFTLFKKLTHKRICICMYM